MPPGGKISRYCGRFGENVLRHGSHEWLPYSKNAVRTKSSNNNSSFCLRERCFWAGVSAVRWQVSAEFGLDRGGYLW